MMMMASTDEQRDWSLLPNLSLYSIATRLATFADFFTFGRVCHTWNSATAEAKVGFMAEQSPLVLCSATVDEEAIYNLYSIQEKKFYSTKFHNTGKCIGFSHGHLIMMMDKSNRQPLLVDPFTGDELHFPKSPFPIDTAVLLPITGHDAFVLVAVMSPWCSFQYCHPGEKEWTVCQSKAWVWCATSFHGKVFVLANDWRLAALNLDDGRPGLTFLDVEPPPNLALPQTSASLVASTNDLFAVVLPNTAGDDDDQNYLRDVGVFQLDLKMGQWMRVEDLKGTSLFLGQVLHSFSDDLPCSWGGAGNCIYFTNFWRSSRALHRINLATGETDDLSASAADASKELHSIWSSCVWILPKLCC